MTNKDKTREKLIKEIESLRQRIAELEKSEIECKQAEVTLQYRLKFERLITTLSTKFINLTTDEIDNAINYALQRIGEFANVDRAYVFQFYDNLAKMDNTHEWCAKGIESQIQNSKGFLVKDFPWCEEKIMKFETIHIPRVADLPPEAIEKEVFQAQQIQSLIVIPMVYEKSLYGFLGLDSVQTEKIWSEDIIALLRITGEIFANALARKQIEKALRESDTKYKSLFEFNKEILTHAPIGIIRLDTQMKIQYENQELRRIIGLPEKSEKSLAIGMDIREIPGIREAGLVGFLDDLQKGKSIFVESRFTSIYGKKTYLSTIGCPIHDKNQIVGSVLIIDDITERKQQEETVRQLAYHDTLTGLPNRLLFNDRLALALAHAHRNQQKLAVMFLDLDRFKDINDTLGHSMGDKLLKGIGKRLKELLRKSDTIARMGGDEFILLLPNISQTEDVVKIAKKILNVVQKPLTFDGHEIRITTSIGIVICPEDGEDVDTLMKNADKAMYYVKDHGRNNYQCYNSKY